MKTIGLLGGMSYESTLEYYRLINQDIQKRLGGSHSAKILLYSFDYAELEQLLKLNDWKQIEDRLSQEGNKLKHAGADQIALCANTVHLVAKDVEKRVGLPLIHIAEATAQKVSEKGLKKVLLLGTIYTMGSTMYSDIFKQKKIDMITPSPRDQAFIHRTIYQELIRGLFKEESKNKFLDIINHIFEEEKMDGVILGCTEIPLLIHQQDLELPLFNTLEIHVEKIVQELLKP